MRIFKKSIALLLTLCMLGTCCDYSAFASTQAQEEQTAQSGEEQAVPYESDAVRVRELVEERTETSTSWLMSDGTIQTEIYAAPVRYYENGELVDYDTTLNELEDDGDGYAYSSAQGYCLRYPAGTLKAELWP